jgi:hypothetical protein
MSPRIRVWAAGACAAAAAGVLACPIGAARVSAAAGTTAADDYTAISLLAFAYGTDGRD